MRKKPVVFWISSNLLPFLVSWQFADTGGAHLFPPALEFSAAVFPPGEVEDNGTRTRGGDIPGVLSVFMLPYGHV